MTSAFFNQYKNIFFQALFKKKKDTGECMSVKKATYYIRDILHKCHGHNLQKNFGRFSKMLSKTYQPISLKTAQIVPETFI